MPAAILRMAILVALSVATIADFGGYTMAPIASRPASVTAAPAAPPTGSGKAVVGPRSAASAKAQLPRSDLFTFHSDAFVNLHHFLYRWGQIGPGAAADRVDPRITLAEDDLERYRAMDAADRDAWDLAAAYYRLDMVDRDLLSDEDMVALRDCLVMAGNFCNRIAARDQSTLEMLNHAMPVYRRVFWSRHNAENRRWIEEVMPLARRFEHDIAPRLAAAYTAAWPERRNRVDVTVYANVIGAYTTVDGHITVSSIRPGIQMYRALELLFHQASHGDTMEPRLRRLVDRSFAAIGAEAPLDLWHMTIFYTAGHATRTALEAAGIEYPQTYAEYAAIYERGPANLRAENVLDTHWREALDAGAGFETAMLNVARAWSAAR